MAWAGVTFRSVLGGVAPSVLRELDQLCALLFGWQSSEHDSEGKHTDITCDSIRIGEDSLVEFVAANAGGVIVNEQPSSGNIGSSEETIYSRAFPGGLLDENLQSLRVELFGSGRASADVKTIRLKLESTTLVAVTADTTFADWAAVVMIKRTGSSAQRVSGWIMEPNNRAIPFTRAMTINMTNAMTISVTLDGVASGDGTVEDVTVWKLPVGSLN